MPLLDHFHPPLSETHQWVSFHSRWAVAIADDLNRRLPRRFLAEAPFGLGKFASADVAEIDQSPLGGNGAAHGVSRLGGNTGGIGIATEPVLFAPTAPYTMAVEFPPEILLEIRDLHQARQVLAVVELVSPGNKDDAEARQAFAGKCLSYLSRGIGLVVIDIVTSRSANLHNIIARIATHTAAFEMAGDPPTYAAAYRPVHRDRENRIDLWHWPLLLGEPLPVAPLALKGFGCVALNLEATYTEACERSRIS